MKRLTVEDYEIGLEHFEMCLADRGHDIVPRLRYAFPELPTEQLERMADRHPDTIREARIYRKKIAYCKRRIRCLQATRPPRHRTHRSGVCDDTRCTSGHGRR